MDPFLSERVQRRDDTERKLGSFEWWLDHKDYPVNGQHESIFWFPKTKLWTRFWVKNRCIYQDFLWANQYLHPDEFKEYLEKEGLIPKYHQCAIIDHGYRSWINVKNGWWMMRGNRDITIKSTLMEKLYEKT